MFNKIKLSSFNLLFAALFFVGCDPNENISPDEPGEWPEGQDVYVAGFEDVEGNSVARLWKNGEMQNLTGTSNSTFRSSVVIRSEARSVFVLGDDVYVAGYDVIMNEDEVTARARLWKNGEMQNLTNGTFSDEAISVFVSGNDVYVLGREALELANFPHRWAFKVWKNGEAEIFAEGNSNWKVNSIFVSDGDVYIAGCREAPFGSQATLWKNGVEENLVSESSGSCANSVFVSGGDIYVAGSGSYHYLGPNNGIFTGPAAQLWKNGKMEKLTNQPKNAEAFSVYVSDNGDVYVAGYDGDKAKLWKNGIEQDITDNKDARIYHSVFVKNNDVYIAGYVEVIQEIEPGSGGLSFGYFQANLWKNGKKLNLNVEKYTNSKAFSVFVE